MIQDIERIEYRRGMLEQGKSKARLPTLVLKQDKIPLEIHRAIQEENVLNLAGVYGNPDAGDPIEYDHLRIFLTDDTVEIEFYNRAITLFSSENEKYKRIHRVLCKLSIIK